MVRKFAKNDEGVSAVIGVILMVAITVILAAVIAAFVFSMSNGVSKPYTVGITIKKVASGDVIITNTGGMDANSLEKVYVTYQPGTAVLDAWSGEPPSASPDLTNFNSLLTVGGTYTIPGKGYSSPGVAGTDDLSGLPDTLPATPTHVIVTGYFKDGRTQVIGETDV